MSDPAPTTTRRRNRGKRASASAGKIPVGGQPICSEREFLAIDPVWVSVSRQVPSRFWEDRKNRRNYLIWLAWRLGYRKMADFYKITHKDIRRHRGGGLAGCYWRASLIEGVQECFPEYAWKEWLFTMAPREFWKDLRNQRRYVVWLGQQLGYTRLNDWYQVKTEDFKRHKGGALLIEHGSSAPALLQACYPDYPWLGWKFTCAPRGFWQERANRQAYMKWLAGQLGYTCLDDWYGVTYEDFVAHDGRHLVRQYRFTPALAVMDLIPRRQWLPWRFLRVPPGYWDAAANRRYYLEWLGRTLGYKTAKDWRRVRRHHLLAHEGGALLGKYTLVELLEEFLPQGDWSYKQDPRRRREGSA